MAEVKKVTLKRFNGTDNDDIYPTTSWDQIESKPTTFTPTAHTLNSHSDVNASPADGQVLTWDGTSSLWVAGDGGAGGTVSKSDLQNLYIYGKASAAITKGQAIQFAGAQGDHILIKPAVPSEINSNPDYMIGIAETNLSTNDFGYVLVNGRLTLDTSTYTAGDILYFASAGSTAGALTTTEPTGGQAIIQMAAVSVSGVDNGEFVIRTVLLSREIHEVLGLQTELDGKSDTSHTHDDRYYTETELDAGQLDNRYYTETETDTLLAGKADTSHTHNDIYYTETEVDTLLSGKASTSHTHDDRYYTETEVDTLLAGKSDTSHTHDDRYYTETETDTLLSGKSDTSHTHTFASLTSKPTTLSGFGITDAYTTTQTDSAISTAVSNLVNGADAAYDTLKEIQDAMATDAELSAAIGALTIGNGGFTVTAGGGLTGGGSLGTANQTTNSSVTVSHADTSTQASLTALTGANVVSDIDVDTYGHITSMATRAMTAADLSAAPSTNTQTITLSGAVTGSGTITNYGNVSIATTATSDPTLTINGDASGSATFTNLGNATLTLTVNDDSHNHIISNVDGLQAALDGKASTSHNHDGTYAYYDHFRSLGTVTLNGGTTTSAIMSQIEGWNAFDSYGSMFKGSWSYAGNSDLTDAGRLTELAGTSWLTWTDDSSDSTRGNITALVIAPNTGGSANKAFIYNDQGSGYSPGWREIWTSASDGAGSGLDADLLDGNHASAFYLASNPSGYTTNTGTVTSVATGGGLTGGTITTSGTISHADTSSQASVNNSGATVIQDVTLDTYGHTTGLASVTITPALIGAADSSHTHSQYVEKNVGYEWTGTGGSALSFRSLDTIDTASGDQAALEVYQDTAGADAFMQFHISGDYAKYFGLHGGINDFVVGGWSYGAGYQRVFHDGYHPNADTWTTARTLTIGSTGKSVNGSGNVSWSLAEIGAAASSHNHAASNITSGVLNTARMGDGTATAGYVLKSDGDGTASWQVDNNTTYSLGSFGITATAAELNALDGITATVTELNYTDGVTSNIQTQLNGKAASSHTHAHTDISFAGSPITQPGSTNYLMVTSSSKPYYSSLNFGGGKGEFLTKNGTWEPMWREIKTGSTTLSSGTTGTLVTLSESISTDNKIIAFELNTSSVLSYTSQIFITKIENTLNTAAGILYNAGASSTSITIGSLAVYRGVGTNDLYFNNVYYTVNGSTAETADTVYVGKIWILDGITGA